MLVGAGAVLAAWAAVQKREVVGFTEMALQSGAGRMGN